MKFIDIVWAAFLARQKPVSTSAKPACMNMTRKPVSSVHMRLMAILLWPAVAITSSSFGAFGSLTTTSLAVPVLSPVGSGTATGAAATGAGAGGGAVVAAGSTGAAGAWARAMDRKPVTPSINTTPIPKLTNRRRLILMTTPFSFFLERLFAVLAGPDPDHVIERRHEHLPVPELAGLGRLQHGVDRSLRQLLGKRHLDLDL